MKERRPTIFPTFARFSSVFLLGLLTWLFPAQVHAVIFYATDDPTHNTSAPTGILAGSGWDLEGRWGGFLGTPIAPNLFVTAKHVGGGPGGLFNFRGTNYTVIDSYADPQSDLRIFKICGIFPAYAELYASSDEVGKQMVIFGRGTQRGAEVLGDGIIGSELKGWKWGIGDGVMRWGENVVSTTSGVIEGLGQLLAGDFDANAGPNECHLSSGDSGGGIFINDGTGWKLAGINYAVDGPFNTVNSGPGFNAAIFDIGGLYETNSVTGTWEYTAPKPAIDTPSAFYATRISDHLTWINSIVSQQAQTSYVPVLESTTDLNGAFSVHPDYSADEPARTITLDAPMTSLFLRLDGCMAHQILSTEIQGGKWILHYGP